MGTAQEILKDDPGLEQFYRPNMFTQTDGVMVSGAGSQHLNGWYQRRDGQPKPTAEYYTLDQWIEKNKGRPWYENKNGCTIYYCAIDHCWVCCDAHSAYMYVCMY